MKSRHSNHPDPELAGLLKDLWQRHLPSTRERLILLEDAVKKATEGGMDETTRAEAQSTAHKLSGNLGMFGYREAGDVASEIEHIFKDPTPEAISTLVTFMQRLYMLLAAHL